MKNKILTTSEAAKIAGVHHDTVRRWCESGQLRSKQMGKRGWAITRDDLDDFLLNRTEPKKPGRKPGSKFTSSKTILRDRPLISDAQLAENRRKMDELIKRTMERMETNAAK